MPSPRVVFGSGCAANCAGVRQRGACRLAFREQIGPPADFRFAGELTEPAAKCSRAGPFLLNPHAVFERRERSAAANIDSVLGLGGGSARLAPSSSPPLGQTNVAEIFGVNLLRDRIVFDLPANDGGHRRGSFTQRGVARRADGLKKPSSARIVPTRRSVTVAYALPAAVTAATRSARSRIASKRTNKFSHQSWMFTRKAFIDFREPAPRVPTALTWAPARRSHWEVIMAASALARSTQRRFTLCRIHWAGVSTSRTVFPTRCCCRTCCVLICRPLPSGMPKSRAPWASSTAIRPCPRPSAASNESPNCPGPAGRNDYRN